MQCSTPATNERGFSLLETIVAMGILAGGLLGLAGTFTLGLRHLATSSSALLAREKAREAIESVHTARDTRVITWAEINNVSEGGVFVDGAQRLREAGADGLVNTSDDDGLESLVQPGADGVLGTADDRRIPLDGFTRQVVITELLDADGNPYPTLRQIRVTIGYPANGGTLTYVLTTYISAIS